MLSQVMRALDDDPSAIIPEIAVLLYEDAIAHAQGLVNWPAGKGQGLKKTARLKELRESEHLDERLGAQLYQDHLNRKSAK